MNRTTIYERSILGIVLKFAANLSVKIKSQPVEAVPGSTTTSTSSFKVPTTDTIAIFSILGFVVVFGRGINKI